MRRALLVHGLNSNPQNWWRVAGWLEADGWAVETATLLGHDHRPPASRYALSAYTDDLLAQAPGPWDLVLAHSLGGSAATIAASLSPDWTRRLVLVDPVWLIPEAERGAVIADQVAELALTRETLAAAKPHWHPDDIAAKLAAVAAVDPAAAHRTFEETPGWDLSAAARSLPVPTLVLAGDPAVYSILQPELAREVAALDPLVEIRVIAGAGHSPHRDEPDATRVALRSWL